MGTTPNFGIPELSQSQANPDITHNEALVLVQMLFGSVKDKDLTATPVSPAEGDAYIIGGPTPTGAWAGRANSLTIYWGGAWRFLPGNNDAGTPITMGAAHEGLQTYVQDENTFYAFIGSPQAWTAQPVITDGDKGDIVISGGGSVFTIDANVVSDTKLRDSVALSVIGRSANSTGDPGDIAAASDGHVLRRSGTSLGFGTIAAAGIGNNEVGNAQFRQSAGLSLVGRSANSTGNVADITAVTDGHVMRLSGTAIGWGTLAAGAFANGVITYAMLADSVGLSVSGRAANTTGVRADIAAANDAEVLRRSGTTVGFGTIVAASIGNNEVGNAQFRQSTALTVVGRASNSTGNVADIAAGTTGHVLRRSGTSLAFGTLEAGAFANGIITYAMLADSSGLSVSGRASNSTGVRADIIAANDGEVLRRAGTSVGFGTLASGAFAANTIALSALANASARSFIGATAAGAFAQQNISADVLSMLQAADDAAIRSAIDVPYYEQGTFTPTFTCVSPGDLSVSYATQDGAYVRIGNIVFVQYRIVFTPTWTTSAGSALFAGLPFAKAASPAMNEHGSTAILTAITWPAGRTAVVTQIQSSASNFRLSANGSAVTNSTFSITIFVSGSAYEIVASFAYRI